MTILNVSKGDTVMRINKGILGIATALLIMSTAASVCAAEYPVSAQVSEWSSQGLVAGSINKCGAVVEVNNISSDSKDCSVMLCMYDTDGRLVDIDMKNVNIGGGTRVKLEVEAEEPIYAEVKAFVWDADTMEALCPAIVRNFVPASYTSGVSQWLPEE